MKKDKVSVKLSDVSYYETGYFKEKPQLALLCLSRLVDSLKNVDMAEHEHDINEELFIAINSILKIYLISIGKRDLLGSIDEITGLFDLGYEGYLQMLEICDIAKDVSQKSKTDKDNIRRVKLVGYICGHRTNRTRIHELLDCIVLKNDYDLQIEADIERVTMGESSWEWFLEKYENEAFRETYLQGIDLGSLQ